MPKNSCVQKLTVSRAVAAEMLSVDVQTIDRLIAAKKLRASKLGRRVAIREGKKEAKLARDEGFDNDAKSRRGTFRGQVKGMISLSPYVADLVGAVEPEKLELVAR